MRAMFVDMTMSKMRSAASNGPAISEEEVLAKLVKISEKKNEASASVRPSFCISMIITCRRSSHVQLGHHFKFHYCYDKSKEDKGICTRYRETNS